jgi:hypothetical protein
MCHGHGCGVWWWARMLLDAAAIVLITLTIAGPVRPARLGEAR